MADEITLRIQGQTLTAAPGMTLLQALAANGVSLVGRVGCLGGVCGACAGSYPDPESGAPRTALACQLLVRDGLDFQFATAPGGPPLTYRSAALSPDLPGLMATHPEVVRCRACEACTLVCPVAIDAMAGVLEAAQGRLAEAGERLTPCVSCNLCQAVCEVGIQPQRVMLYARRAVAAAAAKGVPVAPTSTSEARWETLFAAAAETIEGAVEEAG